MTLLEKKHNKAGESQRKRHVSLAPELRIRSPSLGERLVAWFDQNRRAMPWRETRDPYAIWVSEVMLQQTRVETVVPYYLRFLERFPTVERLACAREEEVLSLWSGLGYYRRARSLHAGARKVRDLHGGRFPRALEEALEVPGVGAYTAAAVLSIAYGSPIPVLDGNVERVLSRLVRLEGSPRRGEASRRLRALAGSLMPEGAASRFNQAMMELGATICTPRAPRCESCPLSRDCAAHAWADVESYPRPEPKPKTVAVRLVTALIEAEGQVLLEQVTSGAFWRGLWLFPFEELGQEVSGRKQAALGPNPGERAWIERLSRQLGLRTPLELVERLPPLRHSVTFRRITLEPLRLAPRRTRLIAIPPRAERQGRMLQWARIEDLGTTLPVPSIVLKTLRALATPANAPRHRPQARRRR